MARFMVNMMPKVMGLMPNFLQIGNRIGVKMMVAGMLSMNIPTRSRSRLMRRRMTNPFWLILVMNPAIFIGICSMVKRAAKAVDRPTMNVVAPLITMASLSAL